MSSVVCGSCGATLEESSDTPAESRTPCTSCSSTARRFHKTLENTIAPHSKLAFKAKRGGKGRPFLWGVVGDDLHRKTGQWNRLERVFDRIYNRYHELITDPRTGEVLKQCDEPLSQHTGHGDDKKNRRP
jgi:hypothetical protein